MSALPIYAALSLQLTDMQGEQIEEAQVGEPFLMIVCATESDEQLGELSIKGMQDFFVRRVGQRLMTINGNKSAQYTYQVRIDKAGTYTLGPAVDANTQEKSKTVHLKVQAATDKPKQQSNRTTKTDNKKVEPVLLRLWVDNDTVYVGQKVKALLRFYYPEDDAITIEQVIAEDPTSVVMTEKKGPVKGSQEIEGKRYIFCEWSWDMFPSEAGQVVIPAYSLDYAKHLPMDKYLSGWAALLGPRYEHKKLYSNAITLQVKPLPQTDKEVHAVGQFWQYRISINSAVTKQYEGMVLTIALEGIGNLKDLQLPDLLMPDALKWYPSKQFVEDLPTGQRKVFEYIVQGLQAGDWEIPEQEFNFFDANTSSYKQLKTVPLFVTILPGHMPTSIVQQKELTKNVDAVKRSDEIQPMVENIDGAQAAASMPWWLFIMLIFMPILYALASFVLARISMVMQFIAPRYVQRHLFVSTKKELDQAAVDDRSDAIYGIFMQLFAIRFGQSIASLSLDDVTKRIAKSSWSPEEQQQFTLFLSKISEIAYGVSTKHKEQKTLFNEATVWIDKLERII